MGLDFELLTEDWRAPGDPRRAYGHQEDLDAALKEYTRDLQLIANATNDGFDIAVFAEGVHDVTYDVGIEPQRSDEFDADDFPRYFTIPVAKTTLAIDLTASRPVIHMGQVPSDYIAIILYGKDPYQEREDCSTFQVWRFNPDRGNEELGGWWDREGIAYFPAAAEGIARASILENGEGILIDTSDYERGPRIVRVTKNQPDKVLWPQEEPDPYQL